MRIFPLEIVHCELYIGNEGERELLLDCRLDNENWV